jgi:hypothetical protein
VCGDRDAELVRTAIPEDTWVIGRLVSGQGVVRLG